MIRPRAWLLCFVFLSISCTAHGQQLLVTPNHADGVYKVGDDVQWTIAYHAKTPTAPAAPVEVKYTLKRGGLKAIASGACTLTDGKGTVDAKFDGPGTLLLEAAATVADKPVKALGGAVASPEQIQPSMPRPDDFDAFWQAQIDEVSKIPANPRLEEADAGKEGVRYYKVTLDNVNNSKIRGQLARPAKGEKFPAMLIVQWAGVYPLQKPWVVDRAKEGWLALNINAHDLPIDQPPAFYAEQNNGPLKGYPRIGNDSRETSYFRRMYLSCWQAAEYLTTRDDWDGQVLVVTGGSQGGMQAVVTAAIHPRITAAMANVPAGCDLTGPVVERACGWPNWYFATSADNADKVREAGRYYDVMNFAPRVKCPVLVGVGLVDSVCPPAGVMAMFNQLQGPRELVIMPAGSHGQNHAAYYRRFGAWQRALLKGQPAPVKAMPASGE